MKINNIFLRLIIISLFFLIHTENLSAQEYYPLQIGNRWDYLSLHFDPITYELDSSYFSVEVVGDTVMPNGKTYYIVYNYDLTGGRYVRGDSRFIYYFDDYDQAEDTLFHLLAQVGDYWEVMFGATMHISVEYIDTVYIFGFQTRLIEYRLDGLILFYVTFSDKYGPVDYYWTGEPPGTDYTEKYLIGCILDSIEYGNPLSVKENTNIPEGFYISQNYPNPFNPTTKIRFTIPEFGFTSLKVYDILGREVATLVKEEKPTGECETVFDGSDLTSGVYFYQLRSGDYIETKKMVLMK